MVATKKKGSMQSVAELIQSEVAFGGVELCVLDNVWFRITNVPEHIVVKIETTIINTASRLTL